MEKILLEQINSKSKKNGPMDFPIPESNQLLKKYKLFQ